MPVPSCATTAAHQDFDLELVAGTWPDDISGDVLYSSPQNSGTLPYAIFDWGAVCRLSLTAGTRGAAPGRFRWQSVSVQTPGKRLYDRHPDRFEPGLTGYTSPFGIPNAANTAPLPWGRRLFVTWDAGRPVELHPDTLDYIAEVGSIESWGGDSIPMPGVLPFFMASAHPVADPERHCLWTVKLEPVLEPTFGMQPSLVRWDRHDGTQVKVYPLEGITFSGSIHTVSQSRNWVILCDSGNFKPDPTEMFGGQRTLTIDEQVPVWLIRKDALEGLPSGTPITPRCFTMSPPNGHYYAKWDDADGVSVAWEGMDLMDLAMFMKPDDRDVLGRPVDPGVVGLYNMAMAPETLVEVVFDPESGKVHERGVFRAPWAFNLQLSAMDWSLEGTEAPTLHHVTYQGCRPGNISQRAAELYEGRINLDLLREETPGSLCSFERGSMELKGRWEYPDTSDHITSPTFAPRAVAPGHYDSAHPGGHDGYVVQAVLSDDGFRVELFDAAKVSDGPVAILRGVHREQVPLILHSAWMPVTTGLADAERLRFAADLSPERMAQVPEELHPSIHAVAEECDAILG